jgi:hypothetical protein
MVGQEMAPHLNGTTVVFENVLSHNIQGGELLTAAKPREK